MQREPLTHEDSMTFHMLLVMRSHINYETDWEIFGQEIRIIMTFRPLKNIQTWASTLIHASYMLCRLVLGQDTRQASKRG